MRAHRVARGARATDALWVAAAALLAVVLIGGCSSGGNASKSAPASAAVPESTDTPITDLGKDLDITWGLAGGLSAVDTATISDALRKRSAHMVFPATQPEWLPASSSAEFVLFVTVPTEVVNPTLWTHTKDEGAYFSPWFRLPLRRAASPEDKPSRCGDNLGRCTRLREPCP